MKVEVYCPVPGHKPNRVVETETLNYIPCPYLDAGTVIVHDEEGKPLNGCPLIQDELCEARLKWKNARQDIRNGLK